MTTPWQADSDPSSGDGPYHMLLFLAYDGYCISRSILSPMLVYSNAGNHPLHSHGSWFIFTPGTQNLYEGAVDAVEAPPRIGARLNCLDARLCVSLWVSSPVSLDAR